MLGLTASKVRQDCLITRKVKVRSPDSEGCGTQSYARAARHFSKLMCNHPL